MKAAAVGAAALALALGTWSPARALNEDVMRNVLSSVFLAQNFTAVCSQIDPEFSNKTGGKNGDADSVIVHINDEVSASMTRDEAAPILMSAAGAARAVGLGMIRALSGGSYQEQTDRVRMFCDQTARPVVKSVVDNHEERHEFFERMIKNARQG